MGFSSDYSPLDLNNLPQVDTFFPWNMSILLYSPVILHGWLENPPNVQDEMHLSRNGNAGVFLVLDMSDSMWLIVDGLAHHLG